MNPIEENPRTLVAEPVASPGLWRRKHILDLDDFTPQELEQVFETADAMKGILAREIKKAPTLRGKTLVTLFYEPSTRTRTSFEMAAKSLSADVISITSTTSSVAKGESLLDTIHTLEAMGADVIVLRHPQSGAPYLASRHSRKSIINGGDGAHAHPTQAILDLYTIRQELGGVKGLKAVIVGDILHSRVARSNIWGLTTLGAHVVLCGPPTLLPATFSQVYPVSIEYNLDKALEGANLVMALRLQKERQENGLLPNLREYIDLYQITPQRLALAQPGALIMHPGPVNEGIELAPELTRSAQSVIDAQVANGVAIRMALLYLVMGGERQ